MPFRSQAQQRYLESGSSPLSEAQKKEWEAATDFKHLPKKASVVNKIKGPKRKIHER